MPRTKLRHRMQKYSSFKQQILPVQNIIFHNRVVGRSPVEWYFSFYIQILKKIIRLSSLFFYLVCFFFSGSIHKTQFTSFMLNFDFQICSRMTIVHCKHHHLALAIIEGCLVAYEKVQKRGMHVMSYSLPKQSQFLESLMWTQSFW